MKVVLQDFIAYDDQLPTNLLQELYEANKKLFISYPVTDKDIDQYDYFNKDKYDIISDSGCLYNGKYSIILDNNKKYELQLDKYLFGSDEKIMDIRGDKNLIEVVEKIPDDFKSCLHIIEIPDDTIYNIWISDADDKEHIIEKHNTWCIK